MLEQSFNWYVAVDYTENSFSCISFKFTVSQD